MGVDRGGRRRWVRASLSVAAAGAVGVGAVLATPSEESGTAVAAERRAESTAEPAAERIDGLRQRSVAPITRAEILQRAQYWLDRGVPYDRHAYNSVPGPDGARYTPDCSGYASMAWNLGTSYGSGSLPGVGRQLGSTNDLLAGDILVAQIGGGKPTGHVAIFHKWADDARTRYWGYDHGGPAGAPPKYATFAIDRPNDDRVYVPYRHPNLTDSGTPGAPGDLSQPDGDVNDAVGGPGSIYLRGWAVDPDTGSTPVNVHVYLRHPDGSRNLVENVTAAHARPDVAAHYPSYGPNHGFELTLTGLPAGRYGVEVFGIDSSGTAEDYAPILHRRTNPLVSVTVGAAS